MDQLLDVLGFASSALIGVASVVCFAIVLYWIWFRSRTGQPTAARPKRSYPIETNDPGYSGAVALHESMLTTSSDSCVSSADSASGDCSGSD